MFQVTMIGLRPRTMSWIVPHRLAIGERPGGSGTTHRRIRREEEICWLQKNDFDAVVSLLQAAHNIPMYEDAGLHAVHIPIPPGDAPRYLDEVFSVLDRLVREEDAKTFVHADDVDDELCGLVGAWLLHAGLVANQPSAVATIEAVTSRPLGPFGRGVIQAAGAGVRE